MAEILSIQTRKLINFTKIREVSALNAFKMYSYYTESGFYMMSLICDWKFRLSVVCKLSLVVRKPAFCICENKDADQLRCDCKVDQRLCFRYTDSTVPVLPKSEISSL